jgi:hypothetical protein
MGDAAFVRHLGDLPTRLSRWLTEPMCYKALKARTFAICGTLDGKGRRQLSRGLLAVALGALRR